MLELLLVDAVSHTGKGKKIGKINFRGIFSKQGNSFGRREDSVYLLIGFSSTVVID